MDTYNEADNFRKLVQSKSKKDRNGKEYICLVPGYTLHSAACELRDAINNGLCGVAMLSSSCPNYIEIAVSHPGGRYQEHIYINAR